MLCFHSATHTNTLRVGSTCCMNCNSSFGVNKLLTGSAESVTEESYSAWVHRPITLRPFECLILAAMYPGKSVNDDHLLPSVAIAASSSRCQSRGDAACMSSETHMMRLVSRLRTYCIHGSPPLLPTLPMR